MLASAVTWKWSFSPSAVLSTCVTPRRVRLAGERAIPLAEKLLVLHGTFTMMTSHVYLPKKVIKFLFNNKFLSCIRWNVLNSIEYLPNIVANWNERVSWKDHALYTSSLQNNARCEPLFKWFIVTMNYHIYIGKQMSTIILCKSFAERLLYWSFISEMVYPEAIGYESACNLYKLLVFFLSFTNFWVDGFI